MIHVLSSTHLCCRFVFAALLSGCASFERGDVAPRQKQHDRPVAKRYSGLHGEPKTKFRKTALKSGRIIRAPAMRRARKILQADRISLPSILMKRTTRLINVTIKKNVVQSVEYRWPVIDQLYNKDDQCRLRRRCLYQKITRA